MQQITHLLNRGQAFCEQSDDGATRLCHEVKHITQERAQLYLSQQQGFKRIQLPAATLITLPVQFRHHFYGTLCIASDPIHTQQPAIFPAIAQLLAQACSWLLYTIEQATFLNGQCQRLDYQLHGPLTKREREVLLLMCRGYNQDAIAEILSIAPATVGKHRQHIYEQLGVHCERDAVLVAYHARILSLINESPF